jgi:hypothetical protein
MSFFLRTATSKHRLSGLVTEFIVYSEYDPKTKHDIWCFRWGQVLSGNRFPFCARNLTKCLASSHLTAIGWHTRQMYPDGATCMCGRFPRTKTH